MKEARDIRKKMIAAGMQVLLPAGSQNSGTKCVSSSFTGPTSVAETASVQSGRFPGYPLLKVTYIIYRQGDLCRVGNQTKGQERIRTRISVPGRGISQVKLILPHLV